MDDKIKRVYIPMTETGFYILFCLQDEMHGYNILQQVLSITGQEIKISPGTMYGSLSKMEKDGLIHFVREEDKRKIYKISELGQEILNIELKRIERLYRNSKGEKVNGQ
jgi:DNA-binding PadR family transcriptional regulator